MTAIQPTPTLRPRTERFPRLPLATALTLVGFSIAAVTFGRLTDIGTVRTAVTSPLAIRDIRFVAGEDDRLAVVDGLTGETVEVIAADRDGFIRGALRGLGRDRKLRGIPEDAPYRIIRWDDGRLTLSDTATGLRVQLDPFGPTNSGAFARFLEGRSVPR